MYASAGIQINIYLKYIGKYIEFGASNILICNINIFQDLIGIPALAVVAHTVGHAIFHLKK